MTELDRAPLFDLSFMLHQQPTTIPYHTIPYTVLYYHSYHKLIEARTQTLETGNSYHHTNLLVGMVWHHSSMLHQTDLTRLDSDVYAKRWSVIVKKVLLCVAIGVALNVLMVSQSTLLLAPPSAVKTKNTRLRIPNGSGVNKSVLRPNQHQQAIHQSQRAQALACFERLFQITHRQFAENAKLKLPVLNSVRLSSSNNSEIVLFVAFDREANMQDEEHRVYRDGTYWCDDHKVVPARVVQHDRKFLTQN